jgi:hypothetical protein
MTLLLQERKKKEKKRGKIRVKKRVKCFKLSVEQVIHA